MHRITIPTTFSKTRLVNFVAIGRTSWLTRPFIQAQYHTYCPIDWSNSTSEEFCWLGDTKVPLPDVNTQDPTVVSTYSSWIKDLVQTYDIDGLRIDGT